MLTPRFRCSQTDTDLTVILQTRPFEDIEVHVEDTTLSVHVNPYFLRLVFSGRIVEEDASSARYDPSSGELTVTVSKVLPGEHFDDLDLLSKLLAPEGSARTGQPLIEVLDEDEAILQAAESDWQLPQHLPHTSVHAAQRQPYGFLQLHTGYFEHIAHVPNEINALGGSIETLPVIERPAKLRLSEDDKWDEEYYMMDFIQDEEIQERIQWTFPYDDRDFNEDERLAQLRLPRREYLVDTAKNKQIQRTLVSILFAYMYDARATGHEPTTESAWTICALTPCFAALVEHDTLHAALVGSYRRALAWPLFRSFALCERVRLDVVELLERGVRSSLQATLETLKILTGHEVYYVYGKIWVEDLCVWISRYASAESLSELAAEVKITQVQKADIGWNLEELELAARLAVTEVDSDDE
ncbi:SHQ1-domain-containing protein [Auriculariales sp. MPI-PUGE-AT-0066]|nr:SHQ1-domain-containing protein [Auriculariales sp. MPI-PUGE-AT-0066]